METEGGLSSKRYNKVARRFHSVSKKDTEKPHSMHYTTLSSIVIESSFFIGSSEQNSDKEFNDLLIWPSILCLI